VNNKLDELERFLNNNKVDIANIQESKLLPKDRPPSFHGYNTIRLDRPDCQLKRGGGLLTFIKKGLAHQTISSNTCTGLESLSIEISTNLDTPLILTNAYLPPTSSDYLIRKLDGREERIPVSIRRNEIITADLNAHDPLWDAHGHEDTRGERLADHIMDSNGTIHNTEGSFTRHNNSFSSISSPDITFSHEGIGNSIHNWRVVTDLSSDHLPILFEIVTDTTSNTNNKTKLTWNWRNANWPKFTLDCDQMAIHIPKLKTASAYEQRIRKTILKSAHKNIGMKKVGQHRPQCLPENILSAITNRNNLRVNKDPLHAEATKEIQNLIRDHKKTVWKVKILDDMNTNNMWNTLRMLQGEGQTNADKALQTDNGTRITDRSKANAFRGEYARVSNPKILKCDRWAKKSNNTRLRQHSQPIMNISQPFTNIELNNSINSIDENKAAGPDQIHPKLIRHLGPVIKERILEMFNISWQTSQVPQQWRTADIRPVPKKGKDPSKIASHRPISLTSCMGKAMERLVNNRLKYCLENQKILAPEQAGFRARRSTEDQIIRLTQSISDGFQKKPMDRTLLALLDLSKAYDTVWRDGLLHKMLNLNLDKTAIRWVQSWLSNRRNFVSINGTHSKTATFNQGVPQGSVISPLLFLIYINDLPAVVEDKRVKISLFADDIALYTSGRIKSELCNLIQSTTDKITEWASKWKLQINASKCSTTLFSNDNKDVAWEANITINGSNVPNNSNPTFLGITFDRSLTFNAHVNNIVAKIKSRTNIIRKLAGTDWGFEADNLRSTYIALCRSTIEYAAAGWTSWLSPSSLEKLEAAQRFAGRAISGLIKTTPTDIVLVESNLPTVKTRLQQINAIAFEKALRSDKDNPRQVACAQPIKQRTKRNNWRDAAKKNWEAAFGDALGNITPLPPFHPPWTTFSSTNFFKAMDKKKTPAINNEAANKAIENLSRDADIIAFTDGSAQEANKNGGSGVFFSKPRDLPHLAEPAGLFTSSYQAEIHAIAMCLQAINHTNFNTALVITDSLSSWHRVRDITKGGRTNNSDEANIRTFLSNNTSRTYNFLWSPSHCDVHGNDEADKIAGRGSKLDQSSTSWNMDTAKAKIKSHFRRHTMHDKSHTAYTNTNGNTRFPKHTASRAVQVLASRVRSNHHPDTLHWRHKMGLSEDHLCRLCNLDSESAHHIVTSCPAIVNLPDLESDVLFNATVISSRWAKWKAKTVTLPLF